MTAWLLAIALVCFLEGAVIAISPKKWQDAMKQLINLDPGVLRKFGLALVGVAFMILILLVWSNA